MNADRPITQFQDDSFERSSFARDVAKVVASPASDQCVVMALNGSWGSGKSSLLQLVLRAFDDQEEKHRPIVVTFNPWQFGGHQLFASFFDVLSRVLGREDAGQDLRRAAKAVSILASATRAAKVIPGASGIADLFSEYLSSASDVLGKSAESLESDIEGLKAKISELLRKQDRRIVIFIDDIDRLAADEVRELFRLVRTLADFANVTYLLAFDRNATVTALDLLQPGKGSEFLEKIVQVSFNVPFPGEGEIERLIDDTLSRIFNPFDVTLNQDHLRQCRHAGFHRLFETPRDLVRFENALTFNAGRIAKEVNPVDLSILTAIQVFCTDLYLEIPLHKGLLTVDIYTRTMLSSRNEEEKKHVIARYESLLNQSPADKREISDGLLKVLFPNFVREAIGEVVYSSRSNFETLNSGHVEDSSNFDKYFRFGLSRANVGKVPYSELRYSFSSGSELKQKWDKIVNEHNCEDTLIRLTADLKEKNLVFDPELCCIELTRLLNAPRYLAFVRRYSERLLWNMLLTVEDKKKRLRILLKIIEIANNKNVLVSYLVHLAILEHEDPNRKQILDKLVEHSDLPEIKSKMNQQFEKWHKNGEFALEDRVTHLFYAWRWCDKTLSIEEKFAPLVRSDDDLVSFLEMWSFGGADERSIDDFISIATLKTRVLSLRAQEGRNEPPTRRRFVLDFWASILSSM
ncbi:MAG: AAA family ATPase [Calditrichaeota bacterium]|nr:AAA family ATPase [Calditrichota bacterium]